ncbi:LOW QUALITY PROTEIN: glutamate-rich protein 6 [Rhynchonycteris naso]
MPTGVEEEEMVEAEQEKKAEAKEAQAAMNFWEIMDTSESNEDDVKSLRSHLTSVQSPSLSPMTRLSETPTTLTQTSPNDTLLQTKLKEPKLNTFCELEEEEMLPKCELGSNLRTFLHYLDAYFHSSSSEPIEYPPPPCCSYYQDLINYISEEKRKTPNSEDKSICIDPHTAQGTEADRLESKERALQRKQEKETAKHLARVTYVDSFSEDESRTLQHSYQLSLDVPKKEEIVEKQLNFQWHERILSIACCNSVTACGKILGNEFLEKYYKHGTKFQTSFPDGKMQIFHFYGLRDRATNPALLAMMDSCRNTCNHPCGKAWVCINILGRQYFDQTGNRKKINWSSSVTSHPFHLNVIFLVRIITLESASQDKISLTFLAMFQQARISVGTKVKLKNPKKILVIHVTKDDVFLLVKLIKALHLLQRMERWNYPSGQVWEELKQPSYLSSLSVKPMAHCYIGMKQATVTIIADIINETI